METMHIKAHAGVSGAQIQSIAFTPAKSVQSSLTPIVKQKNMAAGTLPQASAPYLVNMQINHPITADTDIQAQPTVIGLLLEKASAMPWHVIKPALFFITGCLLMILWMHG